MRFSLFIRKRNKEKGSTVISNFVRFLLLLKVTFLAFLLIALLRIVPVFLHPRIGLASHLLIDDDERLFVA